MVSVDAGSYTMGSRQGETGADGDERLHVVVLSRPFAIGRTEVTQAAYEACMGANPAYFAGSGADLPVEEVSWHDAAAFTNALSRAEGRSTCYACTGGADTSWTCALDPAFATPYDCSGYRLPTEAEWEIATRAGSQTAFPSGGGLLSETMIDCDPTVVLDNGVLIAEYAWFCGNSDFMSHAVGTLVANPWGLFDTSGNVWEWVSDAYQLRLEDATDPYVATGDARVNRGGSWYDGVPCALRSSARGASPPEVRSYGLGFRVARTE